MTLADTDRVGALSGTGGEVAIAAGKLLQIGGTATNRGVQSFGGVLSGAGGLEFTGTHNTTVLTGTNTLTGNLAVNVGKLVVNGSLANAQVTVGAGGSLGGTGTIGALALSAGAVYMVEVDATKASQMTSAGAVTLNGATLRVADTAGTPTSGQLHTIVQAAGGVTGTFGSVTDDYAFYDAAVGYEANAVKLTMTRNDTSLAAVAGTDNQRAAATGLNALPASNPIAAAVLGLSGAQAQAAYDGLSGEVYADVQGRAVQGAGQIADATLDYLRPNAGADAGAGSNDGLTFSSRGTGDAVASAARAAGPQFWGRILGVASQQSRNDGFAAVTAQTVGLVGGMDFASDGPWTFGALFAGSRTSTTMSDRSSNADTTNASLGMYGARDFGDMALGFGLLHDIGATSAQRTVSVGGISQTLSSSYTTNTTLAFAEVSGKVPVNFGTLTPFLRLSHAQTQSGGFTETGGSAALTRAAQTSNATIAELGLRGAAAIKVAGKDATLTGGISVQSVVAGSYGTSLHGFAAGGGAFNVAGGVGANQAARVDLGLKVKLAEGTDLDFGYSGTRSGGVANHQLGVSLSMKF